MKLCQKTQISLGNLRLTRQVKMDNKELKLLMTKVAKGEISQKEVELLINQEKMHPDKPRQEFEGEKQEDKPNTRKRKLNAKGG